jgi:hypothetical protein
MGTSEAAQVSPNLCEQNAPKATTHWLKCPVGGRVNEMLNAILQVLARFTHADETPFLKLED